MKIYAPVKDANGTWASVHFTNGVGETDDLGLIQWFKNHGYTVEVDTTQTQDINEVVDNILNEIDKTEPDFDSMTPNEIRDWAKSNGYGSVIKNTRNKEKLIEIIKG